VKHIKISDAKNNLSRHLKYIQRGGRIRILDRDRPVADLVPVGVYDDDSDEALLASLERRGLARRGIGSGLVKELLRPGPPDPKGEVLKALLEERRRPR
jgi:antitoxin (DNA-binding transcriptional repressor) of toxin-antitoxin stability system